MAADCSAFIDQTTSMNLFVKTPNFRVLNSMHFYSWRKKLKTRCYYLRSLAKSQAQKFSVDLEKTKQPQSIGNEANDTKTDKTEANRIAPKIEEKQEPECLMCSS